MGLITISAKELALNDILGEGQEVWCIMGRNAHTIKVFWGPPGTCLLMFDPTKNTIFNGDDKIKVLRRH